MTTSLDRGDSDQRIEQLFVYSYSASSENPMLNTKLAAFKRQEWCWGPGLWIDLTQQSAVKFTSVTSFSFERDDQL
jgi:hypothetical protein